MPSRKRSVEFGEFVRKRRDELGISQTALAKQAGMRQPAVSSLEQEGVIPFRWNLPSLCETLKTPLEDAKDVLERSVTDLAFVAESELAYRTFKERLRQRAQRAAVMGAANLTVYLVRPDPQQVDRVAIDEFRDILKSTPVDIMLMFAGTNQIDEYRDSVDELLSELKKEGISDIDQRVKGFARKGRSMDGPPLLHPYVLFVDDEGHDLWLYHVDAHQYHELLVRGRTQAQSRLLSLQILPCFEWQAGKLRSWLTLRNGNKPQPAKWHSLK